MYVRIYVYMYACKYDNTIFIPTCKDVKMACWRLTIDTS